VGEVGGARLRASGRFPPGPGRPQPPATPPPNAGRLQGEQTCLEHSFAWEVYFCAFENLVAFKVVRVEEFIP
jgi:hypothetical protein